MPIRSLKLNDLGKPSQTDIDARVFVNAQSGFGLYEPLQKRIMQMMNTLASQNLFPGQEGAQNKTKGKGVDSNANSS